MWNESTERNWIISWQWATFRFVLSTKWAYCCATDWYWLPRRCFFYFSLTSLPLLRINSHALVLFPSPLIHSHMGIIRKLRHSNFMSFGSRLNWILSSLLRIVKWARCVSIAKISQNLWKLTDVVQKSHVEIVVASKFEICSVVLWNSQYLELFAYPKRTKQIKSLWSIKFYDLMSWRILI